MPSPSTSITVTFSRQEFATLLMGLREGLSSEEVAAECYKAGGKVDPNWVDAHAQTAARVKHIEDLLYRLENLK